MKDAWVKYALAGCLALLIGCAAIFYYTVPEGDGHRACEQAAAVAAEQGRSAPAALKSCEEAGQKIARMSR